MKLALQIRAISNLTLYTTKKQRNIQVPTQVSRGYIPYPLLNY
ncbi:hypothetical protein VB713_20740 [Anabaena cylindrica UHCC 0172]|nr:hypothetical protein [Anabaena cylindrica]MEA5553370.1 hypothetical protein [Anabaena cylindrica UHCC 0172]